MGKLNASATQYARTTRVSAYYQNAIFKREVLAGLVPQIVLAGDQLLIRLCEDFFELDFSVDVLLATC